MWGCGADSLGTESEFGSAAPRRRSPEKSRHVSSPSAKEKINLQKPNPNVFIKSLRGGGINHRVSSKMCSEACSLSRNWGDSEDDERRRRRRWQKLCDFDEGKLPLSAAGRCSTGRTWRRDNISISPCSLNASGNLVAQWTISFPASTAAFWSSLLSGKVVKRNFAGSTFSFFFLVHFQGSGRTGSTRGKSSLQSKPRLCLYFSLIPA